MAELTSDLAGRFRGDPNLSIMLDQLCELADQFVAEDGLPVKDAAKLAFERVLADQKRGAA